MSEIPIDKQLMKIGFADLANAGRAPRALDQAQFQASLDRNLQNAVSARDDDRARRVSGRRRILGATLLSAGLATGLIAPKVVDAVQDKVDPMGELSGETSSYTVSNHDVADTAWEIADLVEDNVDGIADNQPIQPFVDSITAQLPEGQGDVINGQSIQLPVEADRLQDPGMQLSSK